MAQEEDRTPKRLVIRQRRPSFSKEQRVGFGLFLGIGTLAVILGTVYVARHLSTPFVIEYEGEPVLAGADHAAAQLALLQESDTDGDGLSDYLELYAYSTSPYLADTDGDGFTDADEIASGNNPNCIQGQDCEAADSGETDQSSSALSAGFVEESFGALGVSDANDLNQGAETLESLIAQTDPVVYLLENTTPDEVRAMLLESGVDPELYKDFSDEEIMQLFSLTLEELRASGELDAVIAESLESSDF